MTRPRITHASRAELHHACGERFDTVTVVMTRDEGHVINRVREMVAARFLLESRDDGTLPASHRALEAMDALCDQLGLLDGPNRVRAREAGARDPMGPEEVARFIGESVKIGAAA